MVGGHVVLPIVAGVVYLDGKSLHCRERSGTLRGDAAGEDRPPARVNKGSVDRLRSFLQKLLLENDADSWRQFWQQVVFAHDLVTLRDSAGVGHGGPGGECVE